MSAYFFVVFELNFKDDSCYKEHKAMEDLEEGKLKFS